MLDKAATSGYGLTVTESPVEEFSRCQVQKMRSMLSSESNLEAYKVFNSLVAAQESLIRHQYDLTAYKSVSSLSSEAVALWEAYIRICDTTMDVLREAKVKFPNCGADDLYDETLDHRNAAAEKHRDNLNDLECQKTPVPTGLFPSKNSRN